MTAASPLVPPPDVAAWRRDKRRELLARRSAIPDELRRRWNERITQLLIRGFPRLESALIGFCWPYKGEFDPRFAVRWFRERGARAALPVVVAKGAPLEFREWWPGKPVTPGVFELPVPDGPAVLPDALLIPPIGFGPLGYRLGYGGGYFDRTLAAAAPQPLKIGVAYEESRIDTIYPQPHDVPMDFIVTEAGIHYVGAEGLVLVDDFATAAWLADAVVRSRSPAATPLADGGMQAEEVSPPPPMSREELRVLLTTLLGAQRTGVRMLGTHLSAFPSGGDAWLRLRLIRHDAEHHCQVLDELLRSVGGDPAAAPGEMPAAMGADTGRDRRLDLLIAGQRWIAWRVERALPRV
ncbi:MAG TPA: 5-formyltetrahydrofolate cyclo-ligase, partial [Pelomicrobium sp.]|nr:5-formyltetrahydrofolate cyclo-ligase [Pelomicrobium sp.]